MKKLLVTVVVLASLALALIGSINRTPLKDRDFYKAMIQRFDTLKIVPSPKGKLHVGWSSFNITPNHTMPMAGYAPRNHFDSVHDSLFTKVLAISNESTISYLITIDLLLFPPRLKELVVEKMKEQKRANEFLYLSASHTHSGLGGWNESMAGQFIAGKYDAVWLNAVADSIISNMNQAKKNSLPAKLSYWETDAGEYVTNRLVANGKIDGKLRGLKIIRQDSSDAILFTYSAHPTNINHLAKIISGDYPNAINKKLNKKGIDFSIFMAGMIGSHRLDHIDKSDYELVNSAAELLSDKILIAPINDLTDSITISSRSIDLPLAPSQLRIGKNWKIRDWLFTLALGKLKADITYLRIGDILMLGTSCDFSGELAINQKLEQLSNQKNLHLIITSFNGNYTGYITDDSHYDGVVAEEVRAMNWVGPYYGEYYGEVVKKLISK